jgi:hypothetical protein
MSQKSSFGSAPFPAEEASEICIDLPRQFFRIDQSLLWRFSSGIDQSSDAKSKFFGLVFVDQRLAARLTTLLTLHVGCKNKYLISNTNCQLKSKSLKIILFATYFKQNDKIVLKSSLAMC